MAGIGDGICWRVRRSPDGTVTAGVDALGWSADETPRPGDAVVRVEAAGVNYKDALCCSGHPGVMRTTPLVPGIDAAGVVVAGGGLPVGTAVVATGHGLGEVRDGGFATLVRAPAHAVIPRPAALPADAAMALGTAGLTSLIACDRLESLVDPRHAVADEAWLVTGASGGVGMLAVAVLAAAGRRVAACSRKSSAAAALRMLGAADVVAPEAIRDPTPKSLVKGRWAGVIDTVGGPLLADVLRAVRPGGAVAAIGMAGGADLLTSVHPFILRGVTLAGIDAAGLPTQAERAALWLRLADLWPRVSAVFPVTRLGLADVGGWASRMLAGETTGRGVVIP
ncbi:MAG: zinc-binding dehydrogenase [Planctomycetaceae bacterium]